MAVLAYLVVQTLITLALLVLGYRYVLRRAREDRAASITDAPDETDYVPEPVTRDFIQRVSINRERHLATPAEQGLADELVHLNPANLAAPEPDDYDAIAAPVLALLRAEPFNVAAAQADFSQLIESIYGSAPANVAGTLTYLRNWWAAQPTAFQG